MQPPDRCSIPVAIPLQTGSRRSGASVRCGSRPCASAGSCLVWNVTASIYTPPPRTELHIRPICRQVLASSWSSPKGSETCSGIALDVLASVLPCPTCFRSRSTCLWSASQSSPLSVHRMTVLRMSPSFAPMGPGPNRPPFLCSYFSSKTAWNMSRMLRKAVSVH